MRPQWIRITHRGTRARRAVGGLVVAAVVVATVPIAAAQDFMTEAERRAAAEREQRQSEIAVELDVLRASDVEISERLDALTAEAADLEARTDGAEAELAATRERLDDLEGRLAAARDEVAERRRLAQQRVVQAYMHPPIDTLSAVLRSTDLTEAERRRVLADNVAADDRRVVADLRAAVDDLAVLEAEAEGTAATLEARLDQQRADLERLEAARAETAALSAALDERIAVFQREADALAASEADLVALISSRQAAAVTTTTSPSTTQAPRPPGGGPTPSTAPPTTAPPSGGGSLIWPASGVLTSPYGWRWGTMHRGIDIGAPSGTPIYAADGGTVFFAGWMGGYGLLTLIDHGDGRVTAYAHQSSLAMSGGTVGRGGLIGYVGSTGDSTGPHLHFELRIGGTAVDPLPYLP